MTAINERFQLQIDQVKEALQPYKQILLKGFADSDHTIFKISKKATHIFSVYLLKLSDGSVSFYAHLGKNAQIGKGKYKKVSLAVNLETGSVEAFAKNKIPRKQEEACLKSAKIENELLHSFPNSQTIVQATFSAISKRKQHYHQYILMPYCNEGDLASKINHLSTDDKLAVSESLLSALADFHQKGWYHNDLKPQNVLLERKLDGSLAARLVDFGFSSPLNITFQPGTLFFRSPDTLLLTKSQFFEKLPEHHLTGRDNWAMGLILYLFFMNGHLIEPLYLNPKPQSDIQNGHLSRAYIELYERDKQTLRDPLSVVILGLMDPSPDTRWSATKALEAFKQLNA